MEKYDIVSVLGEGTYGVVLKAVHRETGQIVAIKRFKYGDEDEQTLSTSLREVRLLTKLNHDNVISLVDYFRREGRLYLVFEYAEHTLLNFIEKYKNGLKPVDVRRFIYQLLRGLRYCHENHVIHRDVKPENVLVTKSGIVKLCDFGFAREMEQKVEYTDYVATRWYRPPELLVGDVYYSTPVDVWAVGCIFAELSDSQPLFPGESDIDQLAQILRCTGQLPDRLKQIFKKRTHNMCELPTNQQTKSLSKRFCNAPPDWLQFLKACLQNDPARRATCKQLMEMTYFTRNNFNEIFERQIVEICNKERLRNRLKPLSMTVNGASSGVVVPSKKRGRNPLDKKPEVFDGFLLSKYSGSGEGEARVTPVSLHLPDIKRTKAPVCVLDKQSAAVRSSSAHTDGSVDSRCSNNSHQTSDSYESESARTASATNESNTEAGGTPSLSLSPIRDATAPCSANNGNSKQQILQLPTHTGAASGIEDDERTGRLEAAVSLSDTAMEMVDEYYCFPATIAARVKGSRPASPLSLVLQHRYQQHNTQAEDEQRLNGSQELHLCLIPQPPTVAGGAAEASGGPKGRIKVSDAAVIPRSRGIEDEIEDQLITSHSTTSRFTHHSLPEEVLEAPIGTMATEGGRTDAVTGQEEESRNTNGCVGQLGEDSCSQRPHAWPEGLLHAHQTPTPTSASISQGGMWYYTPSELAESLGPNTENAKSHDERTPSDEKQRERGNRHSSDKSSKKAHEEREDAVEVALQQVAHFKGDRVPLPIAEAGAQEAEPMRPLLEREQRDSMETSLHVRQTSCDEKRAQDAQRITREQQERMAALEELRVKREEEQKVVCAQEETERQILERDEWSVFHALCKENETKERQHREEAERRRALEREKERKREEEKKELERQKQATEELERQKQAAEELERQKQAVEELKQLEKLEGTHRLEVYDDEESERRGHSTDFSIAIATQKQYEQKLQKQSLAMRKESLQEAREIVEKRAANNHVLVNHLDNTESKEKSVRMINTFHGSSQQSQSRMKQDTTASGSPDTQEDSQRPTKCRALSPPISHKTDGIPIVGAVDADVTAAADIVGSLTVYSHRNGGEQSSHVPVTAPSPLVRLQVEVGTPRAQRGSTSARDPARVLRATACAAEVAAVVGAARGPSCRGSRDDSSFANIPQRQNNRSGSTSVGSGRPPPLQRHRGSRSFSLPSETLPNSSFLVKREQAMNGTIARTQRSGEGTRSTSTQQGQRSASKGKPSGPSGSTVAVALEKKDMSPYSVKRRGRMQPTASLPPLSSCPLMSIIASRGAGRNGSTRYMTESSSAGGSVDSRSRHADMKAERKPTRRGEKVRGRQEGEASVMREKGASSRGTSENAQVHSSRITELGSVVGTGIGSSREISLRHISAKPPQKGTKPLANRSSSTNSNPAGRSNKFASYRSTRQSGMFPSIKSNRSYRKPIADRPENMSKGPTRQSGDLQPSTTSLPAQTPQPSFPHSSSLKGVRADRYSGRFVYNLRRGVSNGDRNTILLPYPNDGSNQHAPQSSEVIVGAYERNSYPVDADQCDGHQSRITM